MDCLKKTEVNRDKPHLRSSSEGIAVVLIIISLRSTILCNHEAKIKVNYLPGVNLLSNLINPLSIQNGQMISGKDINDWCKDQILNNKSHANDARRLLAKHYCSDRTYEATVKIETGCGDKPHVRLFVRALETESQER